MKIKKIVCNKLTMDNLPLRKATKIAGRESQ